MEPDVARELAEILSRYSGASSDLIPILQEAQEKFGYLPEEVMQRVAKFLRLTACHVRGGARILKEIEKRLGIKPGETTEDMEYSLETVACIGACALAPTMRMGNETHGQMTTKKVAEVLGAKEKAS
jgi:NADH-quinone oxidoreductase subunit E